MPKELKKRYEVDVEDITLIAREPLNKLNDGKINQEAVIEIIALIAEGKNIDWSQYALLDEKDAEEKIAMIIKNNPNASPGMLMGLAMKELRGKIPGKKVMELIEKHRTK
jgi:Glu-tRNA(Gln) amidotransferase subunit E-like FAD-binding protein